MYQFYIFSNPHKPFTRRIFFINCFSRCRNRINILWCYIFHAVHSRITFINAEGGICTREIAENTLCNYFNHVFATTLLLRSPLPNYYQLSLASSKSSKINDSKLSATGYTSKLSNPQLTIFPLSLSKQ